MLGCEELQKKNKLKLKFKLKGKVASASTQNSRPVGYSKTVQALCYLAFVYVIFAYLNQRVFHWVVDAEGKAPFWLGHVTEYLIISLFGVWRIYSEKNRYTRFRLITLVSTIILIYWVTPIVFTWVEPHIGLLPFKPIFPAIHAPGTLSFFLVILLVFLFGRRVKCGFGCPCVGIRETVGFAFRNKTRRSENAYRYRHIKWLVFVLYIVCIYLVLSYSTAATTLYPLFLGFVVVPYFLTIIFAPLVGNRGQCRYFCPYAATFGLLNRIGFYKIKLDSKKCTECGLCEEVCDMGIPVCKEGFKTGQVTSIEECMGCARCVVSCPQNALEIKDVRNSIFPNLRQDKEHLLKLNKQK